MRTKITTMLVALAAAALLVAVPAMGALNDVRGPGCADIVGGGGSWSGTTFTGQVRTASPTCAHVDYTFYAVTSTGTVSQTVSGNGESNIDGLGFADFEFAVQDPDGVICVYATTSVGGGRHVFDRAPDPENTDPGSGCLEIEAGGGSPAVGFH